MIRCEVIREFTLEKFDELKNVVRAKKENNIKGKLFVNDTFECEKSMADYLMGNNIKHKVVVKVIEVVPEIKIKENEINITADKITFTDKENNKHTIKKKKSSKK